MNKPRIATFDIVVLLAVIATFASISFADEPTRDALNVEVEFGKSSNVATVVMGLVIGVGLSAACGFRVFVPLLGMSIASLAGHLTLASGFQWIGTWPALIAFSAATSIEICAYYIPWVDNVMDIAATPAAIVAGTIVTASQVGDTSPLLQWSLAVIAGGGVCAVVQGGTVAVRAASTGTTGGFGNFIFATLELIAAVIGTVLAIVLPVVCLFVAAWTCYKMIRRISQSKSASFEKPQAARA